jgi:hypothetical protein
MLPPSHQQGTRHENRGQRQQGRHKTTLARLTKNSATTTTNHKTATTPGNKHGRYHSGATHADNEAWADTGVDEAASDAIKKSTPAGW